MEVLSSSNPVPGFQGGTVRHTAVTNMEKIRYGFGHCSSYTFDPICVALLVYFKVDQIEEDKTRRRKTYAKHIGFGLNIMKH